MVLKHTWAQDMWQRITGKVIMQQKVANTLQEGAAAAHDNDTVDQQPDEHTSAELRGVWHRITGNIITRQRTLTMWERHMEDRRVEVQQQEQTQTQAQEQAQAQDNHGRMGMWRRMWMKLICH